MSRRFRILKTQNATFLNSKSTSKQAKENKPFSIRLFLLYAETTDMDSMPMQLRPQDAHTFALAMTTTHRTSNF
jgi:hypothetical protein